MSEFDKLCNVAKMVYANNILHRILMIYRKGTIRTMYDISEELNCTAALVADKRKRLVELGLISVRRDGQYRMNDYGRLVCEILEKICSPLSI